MEERKDIFAYIGQVLLIFGFTVSALCVFCLLFGEDAKEYSTMFALGSDGIPVVTLLQFLGVAVCITALRFLFCTDAIIKRLSVTWRTLFLFLSILVVMSALVFLCGWFPTDMWEPWAMFFLCFGISAGVSTAVTMCKERIENRRMEEALKRLKEEKDV
ncbi:MAG: DUF3021 family protein [Roseburia sp.]|nr:DUF3021 family protein [Roseburia sp.]